MEKIEMSDILDNIGIISLSMIGVIIVIFVIVAVYNIIIERKQLKLFTSENRKKKDSK